jgi:hypothetical protein
MLKKVHIRLLTSMCITIALSVPVLAQITGVPQAQPATIEGTVTDLANNILAGATVVLQGPTPSDGRTLITDDKGFFQFKGLKPRVPYRVVVSAKGFTIWTSPVVNLSPGQYKILNGKIQIAKVQTTVVVHPSPNQIAKAQVQQELHQRVFGVFPNFYVVYERHPKPLTPKLKFKLAFRTTIDPVTIGGVALLAGIEQASNYPDYGQGALGYAKRLGASSADGFTDIMFGGAILPSLLHQDPRYFYQGTGTTKSRLLHALSFPIIARGDNGKLQPNFSSIGGDVASSAISYAYYPKANLTSGLIPRNVALSASERALSGILQEFVLPKFTHKGK